jgi:hypothetical protein
MTTINIIQTKKDKGKERSIFKMDSSFKNQSLNFLETEIRYFTSENNSKIFQFYLDGELVKEAKLNPISDRLEMRSKIHPRDFAQKDMLLECNIGSTSTINKYNKREKK